MLAQSARQAVDRRLAGHVSLLAGPVGERNAYALHPHPSALLIAQTRIGLIGQIATALAAGCAITIVAHPALANECADLRTALASDARWIDRMPTTGAFAAVLLEPGADGVEACLRAIAALDGPIPLVQIAGPDGHYRMDWLVEEVCTSTNTTAAGGNASLMALV